MKLQNYFQTESIATKILNDATFRVLKKVRKAEKSNPVLFAKRIGFSPDRWQADVLRSDSRKIILNCSRQSGKSSAVALLAAHKAVFFAGSLVLIVCPSERQSGEQLRRIKNVLDTLPGVDFDRNSILQTELSNGSRIIALPSNESNIRTFSAVDLLLCDEASRIGDEIFFATSPMLAVSNGQQILLSTPNGARGFFHDVWKNGDVTEWQKIEITATNCPRISDEFLESERRSMPEFMYLQEYHCKFTDSESQIFSSEMISDAIDNSLNAISW